MKLLISFLFATILIPFDGISQLISLNGNWKFHIGDRSSWSAPEFNDQDWELIYAPSPWEDEGFNGYDGFAWYRKSFDGSKLSKQDNYYLNLGFIDDADEVYINGRLIGFSGSMPPKFKTAYNSERRYALPNEVIDYRGENTIAIRVFDVTLGGGIIDGRLGIYKAPNSRMLVDLQGLWDFSTTENREHLKPGNRWKKIMVPSPWEQQGFYKYDGLGWYKKSFTISDHLIDKEEDLVLILGKIDDFDTAYLNGTLIGKTKDRRPFGFSTSFSQLRVYDIPSHLLKKGSENIIEVLVEDIGNVGGIYEGPVGIATRTAFERYFR